jgi:hypothetical protein
MGNMKTHLALHSGWKPFVCPAPDCRRAFSQLGNLKSHQKKLHPDLALAPLILPPTPSVAEGTMVVAGGVEGPALDALGPQQGPARKRVARARSASSPALPTIAAPSAASATTTTTTTTGRKRSQSKGSCDSAPALTTSDWLALMEVVVEVAVPLPVPDCLEDGARGGSGGGIGQKGEVQELELEQSFLPARRDARLASPEEIILARMKRVIGRT